MTDKQTRQWSQFWQQGHITTFGPSLPLNYDGVLRDYWYDVFGKLDRGARVLDVATGNGALATLAAQVSREKELALEIHASDSATINPQLQDDSDPTLRATINFVSDAPCERQPFEDSSFDLICSQFGFEYSDMSTSLDECRRLLVPGGKFSAIAHHGASGIIEGSRLELEVYQTALHQLDVFGLLQAFFAALGNTPAHSDLSAALAGAQTQGQQLNEGLNQLRAAHANSPCAQQILGAITHLAKGARQVSGEQRLDAVNNARSDFELAELRLVDMVAAGVDADDIGVLEERAKKAGFIEFDCVEYQVENDSLLGWRIELS